MHKQKLNDIMKEHSPWSVGVSTKLTASNLFYPVRYCKELDLWFGIYKYEGKNWKDDKVEWRSGTARGYYILKNIEVNICTYHIKISKLILDELEERIKNAK